VATAKAVSGAIATAVAEVAIVVIEVRAVRVTTSKQRLRSKNHG
jgi:hypothetical protein